MIIKESHIKQSKNTKMSTPYYFSQELLKKFYIRLLESRIVLDGDAVYGFSSDGDTKPLTDDDSEAVETTTPSEEIEMETSSHDLPYSTDIHSPSSALAAEPLAPEILNIPTTFQEIDTRTPPHELPNPTDTHLISSSFDKKPLTINTTTIPQETDNARPSGRRVLQINIDIDLTSFKLHDLPLLESFSLSLNLPFIPSNHNNTSHEPHAQDIIIPTPVIESLHAEESNFFDNLTMINQNLNQEILNQNTFSLSDFYTSDFVNFLNFLDRNEQFFSNPEEREQHASFCSDARALLHNCRPGFFVHDLSLINLANKDNANIAFLIDLLYSSDQRNINLLTETQEISPQQEPENNYDSDSL